MVDSLLTKNNNRKRKSEGLQAYRVPLCDKCCTWNWGKHDFACGYIFFLWVGSE